MSLPATGAITILIRVRDADLSERIVETLSAVSGIRLVEEGGAADLVLGPSEAGASASGDALTPREHEVIALLAEGLSNKSIAQRLGIAPDTAKFHVSRLLDKLDATGRTDAVAHAARLGIIEL